MGVWSCLALWNLCSTFYCPSDYRCGGLQTLKAKHETADGYASRFRAILCHTKNVKEIYYQYEDELEVETAAAKAPSSEASPPLAAVQVALHRQWHHLVLLCSPKTFPPNPSSYCCPEVEEKGRQSTPNQVETSGLVLCAIGGMVPGGFNSSTMKAYLAKSWGLGPPHSDGVLLATALHAVPQSWFPRWWNCVRSGKD